MKNLLLGALALGLATVGTAQSAHAYLFTVETANTNGTAFSAVPGGLTGGITATFTYTGPLTLSVNTPPNLNSTGDLNSTFFSAGTITNYAVTSAQTSLPAPSNADFSTLATFLASSGSAAVLQYGSLYTIDLGVLAAGTVLSMVHDDGASVYQNGSAVPGTTTGVTGALSEQVVLSGTGATILYYARENGAPSILDVSVPEPASMALLGFGLAGIGLVRRRTR